MDAGGGGGGEDLWDRLPAECKRLVLQRLTHCDAAKAARVSREFAASVRAIRKGTTTLVLPSSGTPAALSSLVTSYPRLQRLSFRRCGRSWKDFGSIFQAAAGGSCGSGGLCSRSLQSIDLRNCAHLTDADVAHLVALHTALTSIDLSNSSIQDRGLHCLSTMGGTHGRLSAAEWPTGINFNGAQLEQAASSAEIMAITSAPDGLFSWQEPRAVAAAIAANLLASGNGQERGGAVAARGIVAVRVASCGGITDRGIQSLLERRPSKGSLTFLDVSRCSGLTDAAFRLPGKTQLQFLVAVESPLTRLKLYPPASINLEEVNLALSAQLEEVKIRAPWLRQLNLSNCRSLTSLELECPALEALHLGHAATLAAAALDCPSLRKLSLFMCRSLANDALQRLGGTLPLLEDLDASGCKGLRELFLPWLALRKLSIAGCTALLKVRAESTVLEDLDCRTCERLTELRLQSPCLHRLLLTNCSHLSILSLPIGTLVEAQRGRKQQLELDIDGCPSLSENLKGDLRRLSAPEITNA
eukprot:SM000323S12626  [mRNA]  locus=s323:75236:79418:- [translate_table: standard]